MKALISLCALSLALGLASVVGEELKKDSKPADAKPSAKTPDFTDPSKLTDKAPEAFKAQFDTTKGKFTVEVTRSLSPNGADRFYNLVRSGYFKDIAFFRVIPGFMCQFGIPADPAESALWKEATIVDDPVTESNTRGTISYATSGLHTRTTQLFINYANNRKLDRSGFAPFGKVTEGMDVVDKFYSGYGEGEPNGSGPSQKRMERQGNPYLQADFPKLDYIKKAEILD